MRALEGQCIKGAAWFLATWSDLFLYMRSSGSASLLDLMNRSLGLAFFEHEFLKIFHLKAQRLCISCREICPLFGKEDFDWSWWTRWCRMQKYHLQCLNRPSLHAAMATCTHRFRESSSATLFYPRRQLQIQNQWFLSWNSHQRAGFQASYLCERSLMSGWRLGLVWAGGSTPSLLVH